MSATQLLSSPKGIGKLVQQGHDAWKRGDYAQMTDLLERAHRVEPNNEGILLDLGYGYAIRFDFAQAERCFENAIRLSPAKLKALMTVGHYWLEVANYEQAKKCFDRTLPINGVPLVAFLRLAEIYERKGQLKDALAMAERAMYIDSDHEGAIFVLAKVQRRLKNFEAAEKLARLLIANPKNSPAVRSGAWYEIAAMYDSKGLYDDAMKAFLEAKAILLPEAANALKLVKPKQAAIAEITKTISRGQIEKWREAGRSQLQPPLKIALLCGHARSGTTLLEYVLDSHPQVISADEVPVFTNLTYLPLLRSRSSPPPTLPQLDALTIPNIRHLRKTYLKGVESFVGQPIAERLLIDKNPGLTFDLPVFERIFPESKVLVALRDPRDVCLSCFVQQALLVPDSATWLSIEGTINNYASIMSVWLALKPHLQDNAIEVRYEDMVADLEGNARRALQFLGLSWDDRILKYNEHAQAKMVCSPTYTEVRKPIYKSSVGRWRNYQKYLEPYLEKLAPFAKAFGYDW